jgi:hypothetical protein
MNYTPPATGGNTLTYPLIQTQINLGGQDFTKLNTTPLQLIANNGSYIVPVSIVWEYNNQNIDVSSFIYIGFEPILNTAPNSAFASLYGGNMQAQRGALVQLFTTFSGIENTTGQSPLVLWSAADDPTCGFNFIQITITYYQIPTNI